jgi:hypothetical protein
MIGSLLMTTISVLGLYTLNRGPQVGTVPTATALTAPTATAPTAPDMCFASPPTYYITPTFSFTPIPVPIGTIASATASPAYNRSSSRSRSRSNQEAVGAVAVEAVRAVDGWLGLSGTKPMQNPRTIGSATKGAIILSYIIVVLRLAYSA